MWTDALRFLIDTAFGIVVYTALLRFMMQWLRAPFRNPLDKRERRAILAAWTPAAERVTRVLARATGVTSPPVDWRLIHHEPWFNNQVGWIELDGPSARFLLEKALPEQSRAGQVRMEKVFDRPIEPNRKFART